MELRFLSQGNSLMLYVLHIDSDFLGRFYLYIYIYIYTHLLVHNVFPLFQMYVVLTAHEEN